MVEFAGWEMPVQFSGVVEEHRAVRTAAGLFDVSHMGEIGVSGPDSEALLQRLTPNDVGGLTPGRTHYSALLTPEGTYLDDILVYRLGADEFLLVVNAANVAGDLAWIASHSEGVVEVRDRSADYALLALQGPASAAVLQTLTDMDLTDLRYYRFAGGSVADRAVLVSRTGYTGEDGFELYLGPEDAEPVWTAILTAGASRGVVPAGLGARNTLRLEAAMALYGQDIDGRTTPFEAGLDWTVKMGKGDFIGRAALEKQRQGSLGRRLVGFEVTGRGIVRPGHEIWQGSDVVGRITSGTWSPTLERAIGMGYVPISLDEPGTQLEVEVRGRRLPVRTVPLPFYRRPPKKT